MAATRQKSIASGQPLQESRLSAERVAQHLQNRFNPIKGLDPRKLAEYLDDYSRGYLANAALTWDKIERRDPQVASVAPKRKRAVSLLDWEIITLDEDSPEARKHKEALEFFYNNLTATEALKGEAQGGFNELIYQMTDAISKGYAVHEILPQLIDDPETGRLRLTATLRFVPLWFFEATTGRLRFRHSDYALEGQALEQEPGNWLITTGEGIMESCSVAWMYKNLPLKDWLFYCEKFGLPGLHGQTDATRDQPEWDDFKDALENFGNNWSVLTNMAATITPINAGSTGELPHPRLVEYMDRAIATLWRGGDLSTMSKDAGVGATQQEEERENIEIDDARCISETLNTQIDRWVLQYTFGVDRGLAYIKLQPKPRVDTKEERDTDTFLLAHGVEIAKSDLRERYNRAEPDAGEEVAQTPGSSASLISRPEPGSGTDAALANEKNSLHRHTSDQARLAVALEKDLGDYYHRIRRIADMGSDADLVEAVNQLRDDLPRILKNALTDSALATLLEDIIGTELVESAAQARTTINAQSTTES